LVSPGKFRDKSPNQGKATSNIIFSIRSFHSISCSY
jgi:hypothetical protein